MFRSVCAGIIPDGAMSSLPPRMPDWPRFGAERLPQLWPSFHIQDPPFDICHVFVWRRRYLCMLASVTWCLVHSRDGEIRDNPHPPLRMPQSFQEAWHICSTNDDHYRWTALQTLYSTSHQCLKRTIVMGTMSQVWRTYVNTSHESTKEFCNQRYITKPEHIAWDQCLITPFPSYTQIFGFSGK